MSKTEYGKNVLDVLCADYPNYACSLHLVCMTVCPH